MTDHHNEELLGLLDRIKEFLRTRGYPLEPDFLRVPFRELIATLNATRWIGICERAFDLMWTYAASRELSPGKLLADRSPGIVATQITHIEHHPRARR